MAVVSRVAPARAGPTNNHQLKSREAKFFNPGTFKRESGDEETGLVSAFAVPAPADKLAKELLRALDDGNSFRFSSIRCESSKANRSRNTTGTGVLSIGMRTCELCNIKYVARNARTSSQEKSY